MPDRRHPNEDLELLGSEINLLKIKAIETDNRVDELTQEFNEYKEENRAKQDELLITVLSNKEATITIGNDVRDIVNFTKSFTGFVKISKMIKNFVIGAAKVFAFLLVMGSIAQVAYTVIVEHKAITLPDVIPNNKEPK